LEKSRIRHQPGRSSGAWRSIQAEILSAKAEGRKTEGEVKDILLLM